MEVNCLNSCGDDKMTKVHMVTLSKEEMEKCKEHAEEVIAHYTAGDDRMANLPWTNGDLSLEEFKAWVASRAEAGKAVDIETCDLGDWHTYVIDSYGVRARAGQLSEEMQQIGRNRFVRSPGSKGWVCEDDLSPASREALRARIRREAAE
jgi:hypothetical protein